MSVAVMNYVWNRSKSKGKARLVLLAIADNANEQGDAFPGIGKLSKKCNMNERSVQLALNELERDGELQVFPQVGVKTISGRTNLYRVVMEGVKAELPRNEANEVVHPRPVKTVKERKFPQGVNPVSPLDGVNPVSPDGVNPVSPDGVNPVSPDAVNPVSPKPSALPQNNHQLNTSAPIGAQASPDWMSEFFQALGAFAQAELERDPAFEAICRELFGIEHTAIQDKSTRGRINGLAATARNNFQTVYDQHFTDGWTRDLEEKLARAISAFVKNWKATHADTAVPLARDKFGTAFLKFLQTYKPDRKPAPAAAPPPLIQPLTLEERTALAEARKTIRPAWEQTGESTS